jgi:protocatechuate 3,4-dioxygenase alpha subunit
LIFDPTPSQTVGPYFSIGLPWDDGPNVVPDGTPGSFWIRGVVYDGHGDRIPDCLIETWQADPDGRFADLHGYGGGSALEGFRGFARCGYEDGDGSYEILTLKPGPVPGAGPMAGTGPMLGAGPMPGPGPMAGAGPMAGTGAGAGAVMQAPHIAVSVFARGLLHRCVTRIYFADEAEANAADPILSAVPADRRATLIAEPTDDGYRFDIRIQGERETVFFDV